MTPNLVQLGCSIMLAARPESDALSVDAGFDAWLYLGILAQAVIAATFFWQWVETNRRGRFWLPPAAAAVALLATAALLAYALVRGDPVFILGEIIYLVIALRMYYLARQFKQRIESAQWPGFPRVSPEVAEQRHSETTATLSSETDPSRRS